MGKSFNRAGEADTEWDRAEPTDKSARASHSSPVGWRDVAEKDPISSTTTTPASGSPSADEGTVTDRIEGRSGPSLTIDAHSVKATLVGVPKVSIADLVYTHHRDRVADSGGARFCAMFDVENTSENPISWRSRQTTFIGSDGYTYDQAHVAIDAAALAPGCHTNSVMIEPHCRARIVTPVEQLPEKVGIEKVIHPFSAEGNASKERLLFKL